MALQGVVGHHRIFAHGQHGPEHDALYPWGDGVQLLQKSRGLVAIDGRRDGIMGLNARERPFQRAKLWHNIPTFLKF